MSQTQSSSYFSGLRDDLTALAIDIVRARNIDSERLDDDQNIPDQADFRAGFNGNEPFTAAPGGVPLATWLLIGVAGVVGIVVFKKFI